MASAASPAPKTPHLRMHCVNVYVRNQERSLRFYTEQLGFNLAFDTKMQNGDRWVAVSPPDGTAILSLIAPKPNTAHAKLIGRATQIVFVTEDVPAKFIEWSKRGVHFLHTPRLRRIKFEGNAKSPDEASRRLLGEESSVWGGVFTRFRDPDDNTFSLVSFDEVTHALEAQRRAAAEKLELDRRAARELEIAKEVQARLFPQRRPAAATLDFAGICIPARQVGGDYYDFLDLGPHRLGFVIADVVGKGIAAALLMANLQANMRSQAAISMDDPQRVLCAVNKLFSENTPDGGFATLFFAEYDEESRRLRYVNCGHLCALLLHEDSSIDRLDATATVLGLFKNWDCDIGERHFSPGDTLALYTDGITEAFNHADEEFGEERLVAAIQKHRELPPNALLDAIVDEVRRHSPGEQRDDITMIIAKRR